MGIGGMRSLRVIQSISTLICNFVSFCYTYVTHELWRFVTPSEACEAH